MKQLEQKFVRNSDGNGKNTFTQIRRDGDVALYRRETMDGHLVGYEVFKFNIILKGAEGRGGIIVDEDYERYPSKGSFGKSAWFIGGKNAEDRAMERFTELVTGIKTVEPVNTTEDDGDDDEIEGTAVPVIRVVSSEAPVKDGFTWPKGRFTQKELAAWNHIDNYKQVYSDLMKGLSRGIIKIAGVRSRDDGKRSAKEFELIS